MKDKQNLKKKVYLESKEREHSHFQMVQTTLDSFTMEKCMGKVNIHGGIISIGMKDNIKTIIEMERELTTIRINYSRKVFGKVVFSIVPRFHDHNNIYFIKYKKM